MGDRVDDLAERVQAVETKMDQVPASIDQRFDAVDAAFVEQRQYTEFAFGSVKAELAEVKAEVRGVKAELAEVKAEVRGVSSGLGRVERKLDQFIDRQLPPPRSNTPEQPT